MPSDIIPIPAQVLFCLIAFMFIGSVPAVERWWGRVLDAWDRLGERVCNAAADFADERKYL